MDNVTIKDPIFVDIEGTRVRFVLDYNNGLKTIAEFTVPQDRQKGVNEYWDHIVDNFDVDKMLINRKNVEKRRISEMRIRQKKEKAATEGEHLRKLFESKMKFFQLPFVNDLSDEDKASIRRAPNELMLSLAMFQIFNKYLQTTNMSMLDFFDMIEDQEINNENSSIQQNVSIEDANTTIESADVADANTA
jgi:hypothetical protein